MAERKMSFNPICASGDEGMYDRSEGPRYDNAALKASQDIEHGKTKFGDAASSSRGGGGLDRLPETRLGAPRQHHAIRELSTGLPVRKSRRMGR